MNQTATARLLQPGLPVGLLITGVVAMFNCFRDSGDARADQTNTLHAK